MDESMHTQNTESIASADEDTFLGNKITDAQPRYYGKIKTLFYFYNIPLITIGPDCK
jgi:hypothetical protein